MFDFEVNLWAILTAAIAGQVIGFLWYSPVLFAKPWTKLNNYAKKDLEKGGGMGGYLVAFVVALVTAYFLSQVIQYVGEPTVTGGLQVGFFVWLGFMMPVQATARVFSLNRSFPLFLIDTGYQLATLLAMGAIIGGWQ